ncbi:MAG: helix-turn-helix domain-containing protein [Bacteroidaceae bacterium]|nr:helix-turn-helix domain-containing protein [Bacteroidaceae bacterium]MBR4930432.1 helix-turn-helix domain-containing protein [Bacteroidaceae bacterium]
MATGGRPRKEIDKSQFEKLCGLQCTLNEIASFFQCSEDTVERWCKREYKEGFADAYKKNSGSGKISLRRAQFKLAEKNASMAIWLGKQYLGQRDNAESWIPGDKAQEDGLSKSLRELGEELVSDD